MTIRPLPPQLINQIAAGEVIERPASIVKELLENSLDAGAQRIEVSLERGGARRIVVRDDGCGISAEDLPWALARHATSKIASLADLESVATLGFRGEALPSMASVARLRLISRLGEAPHAWAITADGSDATPQLEPASHPPGTSVEVQDLFFNIPARRKFLRTEKTELGHVEQLVRRLALAHAGVGFQLEHHGRVLLDLRPSTISKEGLSGRLVQTLGEAFINAALWLDEEAVGLRLSGWLAQPTFSRAQGDRQFFFVNGRMIRDRLVIAAVRQAYQDVLHHSRYPAYVLFFELDARQVDVNVHPAKQEVRFREARQVRDFLFRALRRRLAEGRLTGERAAAPQPKLQPRLNRSATDGEQRALPLRDVAAYRAPLEWQRPWSVQEPAVTIQPETQADHMAGTKDVPPEIPPLGFALAQLRRFPNKILPVELSCRPPI